MRGGKVENLQNIAAVGAIIPKVCDIRRVPEMGAYRQRSVKLPPLLMSSDDSIQRINRQDKSPKQRTQILSFKT